MAYSFRKLTINGSVSSSGNKSFKKVIPEETDPLQGTWVFNDTLNPYPSATSSSVNARPMAHVHIDISFISNNVENSVLQITEPDIPYYVHYNSSDVYINSRDGWLNEAYKTIEITSSFEDISVSGYGNYDLTPNGFLTWLQANATKQ